MKTGKIFASAALIAALTSSTFAAATPAHITKVVGTKAPRIQVVKEESATVTKVAKTTVTAKKAVRKNTKTTVTAKKAVRKNTNKKVRNAKAATPATPAKK
ncbi:MAG: hypothetical protein PHH16_03480 [Candidatus Gracilibacteria bacterium]|nr:hypothetical protein [Candidatus Gracilibacteria bacterium]